MKWLKRLVRHDPFFFGLSLLFIGFCFIATGVTWVNFRDPPLLISTLGFGALGVFFIWLRQGGPDNRPKP